MNIRFVAVAGLFALSACASPNYAYPRLYKPSVVVDGQSSCGFARDGRETRNTELLSILDEGAKLQCEYADGYVLSSKAQDYSKLPIIALAGLAGLRTLNGGGDAAKDVGKLGILGLTFTNSSGSLMATGLPTAYLSGYDALNCVLSEGPRFVGLTAEDRYVRYYNAVYSHGQVQLLLEQLVARSAQFKPDDTQKANLDTALKLANDALTKSRTVRSKAAAELYAYDDSGSVFSASLSAISVKVASAGRARPDIDYKKLVEDFGTEPPVADPDGQMVDGGVQANLVGAGGVKGGAQSIRDVVDSAQKLSINEYIRLLSNMTQLLAERTNGIEAQNPRYMATRDKVIKCADDLKIQ